MHDHATILTLTRLTFIFLGVSCILSGLVVLAVLPVAFVIAMLTIIAGIGLLVCACKASSYIDWDRIDARSSKL